jgi:hypothetical protein|tara:strand:- start:140 stop:514 length:375 start_codon:yes stop_codon:yes gene_type:complete
VQSLSEAKVENWFWKQDLRCVYEPQIVIDDEEFLPDWVIWPQQGIRKPVIVEYWGLCRDDSTLARWALRKKPKYLERKEFKESIYNGSDDYHYVGVFPDELNQLDVILSEKLELLGWSPSGSES